jgi:hypothetical protein
MTMTRTRLIAAVAAALAAGLAAPDKDPKAALPPEALKALDQAKALELYSLDPGPTKEKPADAFHGFKVLGKTTVKADEARKALAAAVLKGVADSDGSVADCFEPRHGVRAVYDGKTYDFVICFHCAQIELYAGDKQLATTPTAATPEPALDKLLKDAGVPLAPKSDK